MNHANLLYTWQHCYALDNSTARIQTVSYAWQLHQTLGQNSHAPDNNIVHLTTPSWTIQTCYHTQGRAVIHLTSRIAALSHTWQPWGRCWECLLILKSMSEGVTGVSLWRAALSVKVNMLESFFTSVLVVNAPAIWRHRDGKCEMKKGAQLRSVGMLLYIFFFYLSWIWNVNTVMGSELFRRWYEIDFILKSVYYYACIYKN